jgi:hypothetical protein
MRKSTLFISAVLTVFMLATLFGVVSAYQGITTSRQPEPAVATQPTEPTQEVQSADPLMSVAPAQNSIVSPEDATSLAMQMINRSDVYSVESTTYQDAAAYLVTFSSGDLVYVSPTGQILAVTKLQPVVVVQPQRTHDDDNRQSNSSSTRGGDDGEHHEEHEQEHEGGDD